MLASDGSDDAVRATKRVIELQKQINCKVVVFNSIEHHIIPKVLPTIPFFNVKPYAIPDYDYAKILAEYENAGKKILEETKKMFDAEKLNVETQLIKGKSPGDYIIKMVKEEGFDLVVLGCKGHHSKLREVFIGTVAEKTLNHAACDVLIVR